MEEDEEEVVVGREGLDRTMSVRLIPPTVRRFHFPLFMSPPAPPRPALLPPPFTQKPRPALTLARCRCFFFVFLLYMRTQ